MGEPGARQALVTVAAAAILAGCLGIGVATPAHAATIAVTTTDDPPLASTNCPASANPCSLRAAINQANSAGGANTISFSVNGVFKVTAVSGGQLEVTGTPAQQLAIIGNGAGNTILDGLAEDHRILKADGGATLSLTGLTIRNAHGLHGIQEDGTGIAASGPLTLSSVTVTGNTLEGNGSEASFVGAGIESNGPLTLVDSTVSGNRLISDLTGRPNGSGLAAGAGIFGRPELAESEQSPFTMRNSSVSDNTIDLRGTTSGGTLGAGAGIFWDFAAQAPADSFSIDSSTISGNRVTDVSTGGSFYMAGGGVVSLAPGPTSISNSTIDGNSVTSSSVPARGGGLAFGFFSNVLLTNDTISGNSASSGSSVYVETGSVRLRSTIVSSASTDGCLAFTGGTISSAGDNLDAGSNCLLNLPSDRNRVDPMLGTLDANGGPTLTRALLPGSPAIDGVPGSDCPPPAVDQRGVPRPQGPRCDVGAFEQVQAAAPPPPGLPPSGAPALWCAGRSREPR